MPINLHYTIVSPVARAALATAQHLKIDFNPIDTALQNGEHQLLKYLKMNPNHTIPTLNDNGFVLFESRAIMTYLVNRYRPDSTLYPKDPKQRTIVDKIMYFYANSIFTSYRAVLLPGLLHQVEPSPELVVQLSENFQILSEMLGDQPFFAGTRPTLADIYLGTILFFYLNSIEPNLQAWYRRIAEAIPELHKANQQAESILNLMLEEIR